jgi:probable F420-dependent oxidoreductase
MSQEPPHPPSPPHQAQTVGAARVQLSGVGVWTAHLDFHPAAEVRMFAAELEDLGYTSVWVGENRGREPFTQAAILLAATSRLTVATGIAALGVRDPHAMLAAAYTLAEAFPGRFILGLGISHARLMTGRGHPWTAPLPTTRAYLDAMDAAAHDWYRAPRPARAPRVLAALGPRMLDLARERTDGAHTYLVAPEHTATARAVLGTDRLLIPEQAVVLDPNPVTARATARRHLRRYLPLAHYRASLHRQGFTDTDFAGDGSDRLVDAIVAWGDDAAIRKRIRAHRDAGADHVCLQVLGPDSRALARADLRNLAQGSEGDTRRDARTLPPAALATEGTG